MQDFGLRVRVYVRSGVWGLGLRKVLGVMKGSAVWYTKGFGFPQQVEM